MTTLLEDGLEKAGQGLTTLEEVARVLYGGEADGDEAVLSGRPAGRLVDDTAANSASIGAAGKGDDSFGV